MIWDDIEDWCETIEQEAYAELRVIKGRFESEHEGDLDEYGRLCVALRLVQALKQTAKAGRLIARREKGGSS